MRKIYMPALCFLSLLSSCESIESKLFKNDIKGAYLNSKGEKLEFTESTVTMPQFGTRNYKAQDGYLIIENLSFGELYHGGVRFKVLHPDTIRLDNGTEFEGKDLKQVTFVRPGE
ncbi:hypothetical protein [Rufibacter latericius]|uniref:Uncharacterized protein n=1 Tax=Rufibacter latericius TaxID=2487040 RepID=A0A3M9MAM2_9BACT|nr:hypothetical protein [Rufibacter latericius]RNI22619.1 hypothetical protein EFB08_21220 [Rufibacter latericius]